MKTLYGIRLKNKSKLKSEVLPNIGNCQRLTNNHPKIGMLFKKHTKIVSGVGMIHFIIKEDNAYLNENCEVSYDYQKFEEVEGLPKPLISNPTPDKKKTTRKKPEQSEIKYDLKEGDYCHIALPDVNMPAKVVKRTPKTITLKRIFPSFKLSDGKNKITLKEGVETSDTGYYFRSDVVINNDNQEFNFDEKDFEDTIDIGFIDEENKVFRLDKEGYFSSKKGIVLPGFKYTRKPW